MYKLYKDLITNEVNQVIKINGNQKTYIPFDSENSDYQEYLKWVADGNKVEEAD